MNFKYSICEPLNKNILYKNEIISSNNVLNIIENYPWKSELNKMTNANSQTFYNPSLDFNCLDTNYRFCLTAEYDKSENIVFSLWYFRLKKPKPFFGLIGEKEKMIVDDISYFSLNECIKYFKYFVNGEYNLVEVLYNK